MEFSTFGDIRSLHIENVFHETREERSSAESFGLGLVREEIFC
jgi:hypothetical protein